MLLLFFLYLPFMGCGITFYSVYRIVSESALTMPIFTYTNDNLNEITKKYIDI